MCFLVLGGYSGFLWLQRKLSLQRTRHLGGEFMPGAREYISLLGLLCFFSINISVYQFLLEYKIIHPYKVEKKYGLIQEAQIEVKFYFETLT